MPGRPGRAISAVQGLSTTACSTIAYCNDERPVGLGLMKPQITIITIDLPGAEFESVRLPTGPASTGQPRNKAVDVRNLVCCCSVEAASRNGLHYTLHGTPNKDPKYRPATMAILTLSERCR